MKYGYTKELNIDFDKAVEKTKEQLSEEGFGVLSEINVKEILKKKLNVDFSNYIILGACNPPFAYKALQAELEIGLLLPCNLILYEEENKVYVSGILPTVAMNMVENQKLVEIAKEIEMKIKRVIDNL